MVTTIQKWGNSYAIRLPKEVVKKYALTEGSTVRILDALGKAIHIIPADAPETLKSLTAHITPKSRHNEVQWGSAVGHEVW